MEIAPYGDLELKPSSNYQPPADATYYTYKDPSNKVVHLVPLRLIKKDAQTDLQNYRLETEKCRSLSHRAKREKSKFEKGESLPPIELRPDGLLYDPSPRRPVSEDTRGRRAFDPSQFFNLTDYQYRILSGHLLYALSKRSNMSHIPAIILA